MASFRYIVDDVSACVPMYRDLLQFEVKMEAEGFAALSRDDIRLFLNEPGKGSAGKAGGNPQPGGWNRLHLEVPDLAAEVARLRAAGVSFRMSEIVSGPGGAQIILDDPSGNPIELFQPARR